MGAHFLNAAPVVRSPWCGWQVCNDNIVMTTSSEEFEGFRFVKGQIYEEMSIMGGVLTISDVFLACTSFGC